MGGKAPSPMANEAVSSPVRVATTSLAARVLDLVRSVPIPAWAETS